MQTSVAKRMIAKNPDRLGWKGSVDIIKTFSLDDLFNLLFVRSVILKKEGVQPFFFYPFPRGITIPAL